MSGSTTHLIIEIFVSFFDETNWDNVFVSLFDETNWDDVFVSFLMKQIGMRCLLLIRCIY